MGPHTYHYVKFFEGQMGSTNFDDMCNCIMAIIDQTNAVIPFIVTAYPALRTAPVNHMPLYHKMFSVNPASVN